MWRVAHPGMSGQVHRATCDVCDVKCGVPAQDANNGLSRLRRSRASGFAHSCHGPGSGWAFNDRKHPKQQHVCASRDFLF